MSRVPSGSAIGQFLIVLIAFGLGTFVFMQRGTRHIQTWAVGERVEAKLTLLTSDRYDVGCVYAEALSVGRCTFQTPERRFARGEPTLRPYVTVDHKMLLLPDLFERPNFRERYRKERPSRRPHKALKRFGVTCDVELVAQPDGVRVRFGKDHAWSNPMRVWVGKIHDCAIDE